MPGFSVALASPMSSDTRRNVEYRVLLMQCPYLATHFLRELWTSGEDFVTSNEHCLYLLSMKIAKLPLRLTAAAPFVM